MRKKVRRRFLLNDLHLIPKRKRGRIVEWCDQVPVLGFNSGKYHLNMIKKYFVEDVSKTTEKVRVAKNGGKIMFLLSKHFRFLDIMNYVGVTYRIVFC